MTDNSRDLIQRVAQGIEASQTTSTTPPGQTEAENRPLAAAEHIEAINQIFALFRLNYHNQYYAAFPDAEQLKQIKKLWLDSLRDYPVEQLLRGARHAIEHNEYLPTLNRMHECCQAGLAEFGLPSTRDAYVEACNARSPKSAQRWSHPAVYLAGRDSEWFFLANNAEQKALPVFERHYKEYCARVMRGEALTVPPEQALEHHEAEPLPVEEQLEQLRKLREETGL
ncbi:replication protein P [Parahaliea aestuarii]|uniref:replication protein P n=1 Tax=Parahaliea aestuarii TaxID=1852021 RepID=UPI0016505975|nr:replication protein P [Parahaliea aestuarii]